MQNIPQLNHEKLDVYQKSIQFLSCTVNISASLARGNFERRDQLSRAAISIPLNIAEASGRTGVLDRAKHFAIARGSALECSAVIDILLRLKLLEENAYIEAKKLIVDVVSMLSKLCLKK